MTEKTFRIPSWVLHPLPKNATVNKKLNSKIEALCLKLTETERYESNLQIATNLLAANQSKSCYEPAANIACAYVWRSFCVDRTLNRADLIGFARQHFPGRAKLRVFRTLTKDSSLRVRRAVRKAMKAVREQEVALPLKDGDEWNQTGWLYGQAAKESQTNSEKSTAPDRLELPRLNTVAEVRELLGIVSSKQLGWMLLATDTDDGPYTSFSIPKRNGEERKICAPKGQLRRVQQKILRHILYKVPVHRAAHGFVPGRSTVTNAAPHVGKKLVLKFDLKDFFPSIHHFRVVGLFHSLGYEYAFGQFAGADQSRRVAGTLARLCTYTDDSRQSGSAFLPQGAPTSPAITNLICRRLDARLSGLARENKATYTRYADDLTFSFESDEIVVGRFRWWVDQVCHQEGFGVNQSKFRVIRQSQRQQVTGIVVNQSLHIPRRQRRKLRAILHNCRKHGVESQAKGKPGFRDWLRGYASYVHMIHPADGAEMLAEVKELLGDA